MTWNYRMVRHSDSYLYFHEVYYHKGKACKMATEAESSPSSESLEEMQYLLQKLTDATNKPIFIPPESWKVVL